MSSVRSLPLPVLAVATMVAHAAWAQEAEPTLEQRLEANEQRVRILERKLELAEEANAAAASSATTIKASSNGISINSADGQNSLRLRGTLNIDGRYFKQFDDTANLSNGVAGTSAYQSADGFLLRKVRPYIEGTIGGAFDWRIQPELGGGRSILLDSYVAARFRPWAVVTVGKFKNPLGLERLQTEQYNKFIELGTPSSLVPNRDLGVQLSGTTWSGRLQYAVGLFNGVADGTSSDSNPIADGDGDGRHEWAARLFALPLANSDNYYLRGLGIGIAVGQGTKQGNADVSTRGSSFSTTSQITSVVSTNTWLPSYRTSAQQVMFGYRGDNADTLTLNEATYADGRQTRVVPQAYYYYGPLGVIAEYARVTQSVSRHTSTTSTRSDTLHHAAWQVAASWFLTGEEATYNSATPRKPFAVGKPGFGALELALRYQQLHLDDDTFTGGSQSFANPLTAVHAATGISAAFNWYFNAAVRWTAEYDLTRFDGGAGSTTVTDRADERVYVTRVALGF